MIFDFRDTDLFLTYEEFVGVKLVTLNYINFFFILYIVQYLTVNVDKSLNDPYVKE